jgi:hypothetical protein
MKKGTYNSVCWQHVWQSIFFALWSNNALVRTLSNFHGHEILEAGMGVLRKKRDSDGKWERTKTEVPCPAHTRNYCNSFHLIDKGNGAEVNYNLGGKSHLHNCCQRLDLLALQAGTGGGELQLVAPRGDGVSPGGAG